MLRLCEFLTQESWLFPQISRLFHKIKNLRGLNLNLGLYMLLEIFTSSHEINLISLIGFLTNY